MIFDETQDENTIDPDDVEVEIEEEGLDDFIPEPTPELEETPDLQSDSHFLTPSEEDERLLNAEYPVLGELDETEPDLSNLVEVDVAQYRITGLVDYTDEQGNIVGQLPKDTIQELPVEVGERAVEAGQAERV